SNALNTDYLYDALGRLAQTIQGDQVTNYEYDDNNNLVKKAENFGGKLKDQNSGYSRDSEFDNQHISYFVYNEANQLTAEFISTSLQYGSPTTQSNNPIDDIGPVEPPMDVMSSGVESRDVSSSSVTLPGFMTLKGNVRYFDYDNNGNRIATHQLSNNINVAREVFLKVDQFDFNEGAFAYDVVARTINNASEQPKVSEYTSYDKSGRKSLHINADGGVTQWHYDAQGRVYELIRWGARASITSDGLTHLKAGTFNAAYLVKSTVSYAQLTQEADSKLKTLYNDKGQPRFTLTLLDNAQAVIKESRYDNAGQLVETIAYANTVSYGDAANEVELASKISRSEHDRSSQLFYDAAGRLRFTVNAQGHVIE
ncbi:hypothetical protein, partial [Pseudoalteromonas holothuriae]|uniref:hypothetical protein n=1 Tax=Pseudoalteromonas holothuriae TaxID=2963714 RepID=UPI0021C180AD